MIAEKIRVVASKPAALQNAGEFVYYPTTREALDAWRKLPPAQRQRAAITILEQNGLVLKGADIERLEWTEPHIIPLDELSAENDE